MRAAILLGLVLSAATHADPLTEAMAELQPSSLGAAEQRAELAWFARAGEPFRGVQVRVIADGHHRHDLAGIQEQSQRALRDDRSLDAVSLVVDAGNLRRKAGIVGVWADLELAHRQAVTPPP